MRDEEILAIGFNHWLCDSGGSVHEDTIHSPEDIIAFARAVAAAERESCAKVCERYAQTEAHGGTLAEFIRAQGENRE
jgi:hypothetical protein